MKWGILLLLGIVFVAGCLFGDSAVSICTEGAERCVGAEKQACQNNQWVQTGECVLPISTSELVKYPKDYEGREFDVEGEITGTGDDKIEIDDKVWVECTSNECKNAKIGQKITVTSTPAFIRIYNITYTLPRTHSYLAERYKLPYTTFPVSSEGAITPEACDKLSGNYFVENGKFPTDSTQYSLAYAAFYTGSEPSLEAYKSVLDSLCILEDASIASSFSDDKGYMWCAKIRAGDYCYVSSSNFARGEWDWETEANIKLGIEPSETAVNTQVGSLCSVYGGEMASGTERYLLNNIYAFKAPVCKIRLFEPDSIINTSGYCTGIGGTIEDGQCLVVDDEARGECGNNNDVPVGYWCIRQSECFGRGGAFDLIGDEYYCTDTSGIVQNGIFYAYDDNCLYGDITVCNLKGYKLEEEIITEYTLEEV